MLGINGDGKSLDVGCEHTICFTDDALQNCTLENYVILLTNDTLINPIKNFRVIEIF